MDKIVKLLRKISLRDRTNLLLVLDTLIKGNKNLRMVKIKNTDFFRVRCGRFRIIFHKENGEIIIDSIKLRSDNTYKNL